VLHVLNGPEAGLGEALVAHPGIDMVSFTGGVRTGRAVMAAAAATTKPLVLELGGNDPAILAPDVTVDEALAGRLFDAAFVTSGQVCMAIKRLYVHQDHMGDLVDALVARMATEVVGDGLADGVTMGPVHRAAARDRVERLVADAAARGARVHRPGSVREEDLDSGGYLVSPALVEAPPPDAAIVREEQFAPALPVLAYRDLEDAVVAANDSAYGLCASVWSDDGALAASVARRLEAGTVFVNTHGMSAMDYRAPMGGWKQSGFGLEMGIEGMRAFTRPRVVLTLPGAGAGPV
jgi:acyl-CoA reductase-like NAD-dependent aldehyde dehydrogenase